MSCNKSNFQIDERQSFPSLAKDYSECTTAKHKQTQNNLPFMEDGCFWNVNHLIHDQQQKVGFQQLDPVFQGQILRDHLQVIKVALHDYVSNFNQQGGHSEDCTISPTFEAEIGDIKEASRVAYDFVTALKSDPLFKQEDIKKLEGILLVNPVYLRLFLVFSEAAPSSTKRKLYYLIYKGLVFLDESKKLEVSRKQQFDYLQKNCTKYLDGFDNEKNEEKLKTLAVIILYTTSMSARGVSQNRFYKELAQKIENLEKLKLTKFERHLNSVRQKSKKVKLLRRSVGRLVGAEKGPEEILKV